VSAAPHLTYRTYFLLTPPRQDSLPAAEAARRELDGFAGFLAAHGAPAAAVTAWLDAPMLATLDPPPADRRFPLVLVAQGNGQTLHDQAPLCEYLASHGYVVATAPSPMRISGPLTDERDMGARASEQARDLAFVLARAARRADVDARRVGLVGHSFGARAALLLGMREPRVAALVSLDGGIGTATGRSGLEGVPSFDPRALRAPVLHFYERLDPFMAPDFGLLRSLTASDRWLVEVPAMHHHHFASLGAVSVTRPALAPALGATGETARAYLAVARAALGFLDRFLGRDPGVRAWPGPDALPPPLGAPEHLAPAAP
jgi:dienelactone hydrolase